MYLFIYLFIHLYIYIYIYTYILILIISFNLITPLIAQYIPRKEETKFIYSGLCS